MDNIDIQPDSYFRKASPPARVPFRIHALGLMRDNPLHATRGTYFGDAMLTLVTAGQGFYQCGEDNIPLRAGMLGLVLPGKKAGWLRAEAKKPYTHYYCRFAGPEALRMARRIRQRQSAAFATHPRFPRLHKLFDELLAFGAINPANECQGPDMTPAEAQLALLLSTLLEPAAIDIGRPRLTPEALTGYLLDHISEPVSLDRMARHFKIGKAHLCREGKRLLGDTLQRSAEREKMAWAAALLSDSSLPFSVGEVSARVGYNDPLYFSKVFKRHFGRSPRAWRARAPRPR